MLENMFLLSLLLVLYLCCKYILFTQTECDNLADKKRVVNHSLYATFQYLIMNKIKIKMK